jgi:hypothetical protein
MTVICGKCGRVQARTDTMKLPAGLGHICRDTKACELRRQTELRKPCPTCGRATLFPVLNNAGHPVCPFCTAEDKPMFTLASKIPEDILRARLREADQEAREAMQHLVYLQGADAISVGGNPNAPVVLEAHQRAFDAIAARRDWLTLSAQRNRKNWR